MSSSITQRHMSVVDDQSDLSAEDQTMTKADTLLSAYASLLMRSGCSSERDQTFRPRVSTMPTAGWSTVTSQSPMRPHRPSIAATAANVVPMVGRTSAAIVVGERLRRVRSYSVTAKGVTKFGGEATAATRWRQQGGHFGSYSTCSLGSPSTSAGSNCSSPRHRSWSNGSSSSSFSDGNYSIASSQHNVAVVGSAEVGKTSLIAQFIASDVKDDETDELEIRHKLITILLDGEEAHLQFQDFRSASADRTSEEIHQATGNDIGPDAYVIVYSVADRRSFSAALRSLAYLEAAGKLCDKAVILVGNKIDLERCRSVSTAEGRDMATSYGCKFIETSDWMNHNVDELLVGIVNQIRLKQRVQQRLGGTAPPRSSSIHGKTMSRQHSNGNDANRSSSPSAKNSLVRHRRSRSVVRDFFRKIHFTSRSCDNLHVL